MGDPWGIVLVPAEGDPCGLLAEGSCGARPPVAMALRMNADQHIDMAQPLQWLSYDDVPDRLVAGTPTNEEILHALYAERALPLWWDGALVPEGWDRARRVYREAIRASGGTPVGAAQLDYPSWARVAEYASWMVLWHPPLASRVVLLDLVDGRLVEREPSGPEPQQR